MKNGFSTDWTTYQIEEPNQNRFWYNQLFNEGGYTAAVTNVGHGTSRYIDDTATHAVLNEREERFLYLRDESSKKSWNVGRFPLMEPVERLHCNHSMGYSRIETDNLGISAAWTIFVPVRGYHEVWMLHLRNTTMERRTISAFPLVSFDLGGFQQPAYYVPFNCTETIYDEKLGGIFAWNKNPHNPHKRYSGFLASSVKPVAYDGCLERFLGTMGSTARPQRLLKGENCTGSLTTVLGLGAVLQNTITMEPGQSQTICYVAGLATSLEDARMAAEESFQNPDALLADAQATMLKKYTTLHTKTPDERVNSILNYWTQKQVDFCSLGKKAVRDNAQIAMAQLNFQPEKAEKTIAECLCHQYSDGRAVLGFGPTLDPNHYSDPHMWLILACCELTKETGSTAFLEKVLPFQDGGEGTVYDHLKRAMTYMENDLGVHGIPRIRYADWNDALNIDDPEAESVFMAMAMAWACKELAGLSTYLGDSDYAKALLARREKLIETINREAWDGDWYLRAFSKFGPVGSKDSPTGGNIYVNPQVWSILADVVPEERLPAVLKAIDGMDKKYGIQLCEPAYPHYDSHVGRMSGMLPGLFENGGVYNHCNAFKIMADCKLGRGEQALSTLHKMIPDSKDNPVTITGAEPYLFVNCWCMHPSFFTRIWFGWFTGTSAWALRGFYEGICGLKHDYDGLRIQPCLPKEWKKIEVMRSFRGSQYHIVLDNANRGATRIILDGKEISGNTLPAMADNCTHEVEVFL